MTSPEIAFGILLFLTVLNYRAQRSVLYPPFIFCVMWALDLGVYCLGLIQVDAVHGNTLAIVLAGAAAFSIGGWLAGLTPVELLRIHQFPVRPQNFPRLLRNALTVILLCALPVMAYQVFQLSKGGSGVGILMRARQAQVQAAENGEPVHSLVLDYFVMVASMTSLLFATEKKDRQFWMVTAIAFLGCILSTGRTSLLLLIAGLCALRLLETRQESLVRALRLLRWPAVLFVVFYVALIFTNKNTKGMPGGASGIAIYFVLSYIVGPLAAFDAVVQTPVLYAPASTHTFEFLMKIAAALHLTDYSPPPKLDAFVMVPFPTNVYTVFKFYFLDVGTGGILVVFLLFGIVHTLLYLKARQGGRLSRYLFAFSVYSVLMVTFDDAYYTTGIFLRAFIFGFLYFLLGSLRVSFFATDHPERTAALRS